MTHLLTCVLAAGGVWVFCFTSSAAGQQQNADAVHEAVFLEAGDRFPSAATCKECHPKHYREWSVSPHAYSQMSPVFNAMQATIIKLTNGTTGDFCIRCHSPAAMALEEPIFTGNELRHSSSREGITCIACHRINKAYGKISGRMGINEGDLYGTVYGTEGGKELDRVREDFGLAKTYKETRRKGVHLETVKFFQLPTSAFCGSCHDVTLLNGFRLEEAFSEFKNSPAARRGVSCQDCHMGTTQGKAIADLFLFRAAPDIDSDAEQGTLSAELRNAFAAHAVDLSDRVTVTFDHTGQRLIVDEARGQTYGISKTNDNLTIVAKRNYSYGPAAEVRGEQTAARKLTDHMFPGPDHSIIHPGVFPHNPGAAAFENIEGDTASISDWLAFDYKARWGAADFDGTFAEYFEDNNIPEGFRFPVFWNDPEDRYNARKILDSQLDLLDTYMAKRTEVLRNGLYLDEPVIERADQRGIRFKVKVRNLTDGHNVPTGFDAERLIYLQVTVKDSKGDAVFLSGDLDPNGDVRDAHSVYVHNGELPRDKYLFNLQSKFITRMVRGGEREQVLAVNYSPDPLPFLRPATRSNVLTGRPSGGRKHRQTLSALGSRWSKYEVKREALEGSTGPYTASVRLLVGMVPVNLIHEIREVGFDYRMSPRQVADEIVNRHALLWEYTSIIDATEGVPEKIRWHQETISPVPWDWQAGHVTSANPGP
ncbi:MAG: multiheme c-type cytochrome [Gemmatimonadota bacterium]|nr:multiheme c-type cytochrome [Gemmatimonadota bacterium]